VVYHDYEGVALDLDEQQRLVNNLGDSNILILRNHGLLTGGISVEHAFRELHGLERACNIQVAAQAGGNDQLLHAPQAAIAKVHEQSKRFSDGKGEGIQRHWDALIRQLDREGRGYQD